MLSSKRIFIFLAVLLFLYTVGPMLLPVVMGAIFAVIFFPAVRALENGFSFRGRSFRFNSSSASLIVTGAVAVGFLLPLAYLIYQCASITGEKIAEFQSSGFRFGSQDWVSNLVNIPIVQKFIRTLAKVVPINVNNLTLTAMNLGKIVALRLGEGLGIFFQKLPSATVDLIVMVVSLFFLLLDGRKLVAFISRHSVLTHFQTDRLLGSFEVICRSVALAMAASGLTQGLIFGVTAGVMGLDNPIMIAFLVFVFSLIPLVGSLPVTGVVVMSQFVTGNFTAGIVLSIAAALVSVVDNVIRPMILRGSANIHPLVAFVSVFGGIQVFGFSGVFLGPIIAGVFTVLIKILVEEDAATG